MLKVHSCLYILSFSNAIVRPDVHDDRPGWYGKVNGKLGRTVLFIVWVKELKCQLKS